MNVNKDRLKFESLRSLAEQIIGDGDDIQKAAAHDEVKSLVHELQVYQAELELQNEELRNMHTRLERSRTKYYELFDFAPIGYLLINEHYTFKEVNATAIEQMGRNRNDLIDRPLLSCVHVVDHSRMISFLRTLVSSDDLHEILIDFVRPDGSILHTMINAIRAEEESDVGNHYLLTLTDLTELRRTQDAVGKSENIYKALVQSSSDHIFLLSLDGRYLTTNDNVSHFGMKNGSELIGKHLSEVYTADVAKLYQKKIIEVISTKKPAAFEHEISHNADLLFHHAILYPIFNDDTVEALGGICRDTTIEKLAQQKVDKLALDLRQKQKLESLGTLAGGIAHDFNNILSAVIGYTELSLLEAGKGSHLEEDLKKILQAGLRAKNLVAQILAFSRQSEEKREAVPIDAIASEVLELIRPSIPSSIEIVYKAESNSKIFCNSTQIHQILMNLCSNAAHAMQEKGGILTITIKDLSVEQISSDITNELTSGEYVEVKVSDTGIGIPADIKEKIFDPYFTTKGLGTGTGMGLSVVLGIVESYGGKIFFESRVKNGTTFFLYLPVIKNQHNDILLHQPNNIDTGRMLSLDTGRILFVDDEEKLVELHQRLLSELGYKVTAATDSREAFELFYQNPAAYDLIITDMTMPGMSGEELAVRVMEIRPDIPIIICSGYSPTMTEQRAIEIGVSAFLTKPVERGELIRTLRKILP